MGDLGGNHLRGARALASRPLKLAVARRRRHTQPAKSNRAAQVVFETVPPRRSRTEPDPSTTSSSARPNPPSNFVCLLACLFVLNRRRRKAAAAMRAARTEARSLSLSVATVLAVLAAVGPAAGKPAKINRLEKYTPVCHLNDEKISECMATVMRNILKHARTGIPELKIPVLEPFIIPEIDLRVFKGLGALFNANLQNSDKNRAFARNLTVHHSSEFTINDIKNNYDKNEFYLDITFPILEMKGEYDVNIIMFGLPIKSIGPVNINVTDIHVLATLNGKRHMRKGETYVLYESVDIKLEFKDYSFKIDQLFKKDPNLNQALNDLIKSQKSEIRKLMMPTIEELGGKMVLTMVNQVMYDLPLEEQFIKD